jgi:hypothetical protein
VVTAGTAVYCARTGRVQQHREWMIRSYPFAACFLPSFVIAWQGLAVGKRTTKVRPAAPAI